MIRTVDQEAITSKPSSPFPIELYLDNIRSAYNVGSIFRSADAVGIQKIHLGGISPLPTNLKVAKTALGATAAVTWELNRNGLTAIQGFKEKGYQICALEMIKGATNLLDKKRFKPFPTKVLLIVGNEVTGIDPALLDLVDHTFFLPMYGTKGSLNVAVATGAALYLLREGFNRSVVIPDRQSSVPRSGI